MGAWVEKHRPHHYILYLHIALAIAIWLSKRAAQYKLTYIFIWKPKKQ